MSWTVTYNPTAEATLTQLWLNSGDRQGVTNAANRIDALLAQAPFNQGESREGNVRILFERPLAALYEIFDEDRHV